MCIRDSFYSIALFPLALLFSSVCITTALAERRVLSEQEASRFLNQAALGFDSKDIRTVQKLGMNRWLQLQQRKRVSKTEPYIDYLESRRERDINVGRRKLAYHKVDSSKTHVGYKNFGTAWLRAVLAGDDLLRQRVTWALSQILVASGEENRLTDGLANYYDTLSGAAFGSYSELLLKVTYHPVMGRYLSYVGNQKSDPSENRYPDENYAREILQLFSIGLWKLNLDGTRIVDTFGQPIPTYTNEDIKELARVFTGFAMHNTQFGKTNWNHFDEPMVLVAADHDLSLIHISEPTRPY